MKKNLLSVGLLLLIGVASYMLYNTLRQPILFANEVETRSNAVIQKLKDIRTIQRAYKVKYDMYTDNFDELIRFIENDSMEYEKAMGSEDDSIAVARGLVSSVKIMMAAKDTLFSGRTVDFKDLKSIPYTNGEMFSMGADTIKTESGVNVWVFEIAVPYDTFLHDLDRQSVVNLKDKQKTAFKYEGIKVGSLHKANNDVGSWEE